MENADPEIFKFGLAAVAHECGHVEDLKHRDGAFPGVILRETITDSQDAILEPISAVLWEEYAACRGECRFWGTPVGGL